MTSTTTPTGGGPTAAKRYIYAWGDGHAEGDATMRDLLGGKGAGLAEMTNAGLPVPPGFTITTEACNDYFTAGEQLPDGLWDDVLEAVREVEAQTGKGFGDAAGPAPRVSVRSGAKFSMPGMMDTVLNLGPQRGDPPRSDRADRQRALRLGRLPAVHPDVRPDRHGREGRALRRGARGGQARPRRRSRTPTSTPTTCRRSSTTFKAIVREDTGRDFPSDPYEQLDLAIKAVFASWFGKRAIDYRNNQKIAHDLGTAVNVVTMVFGNMGDDSGTGVAFTRDPNTGEKTLFGEYLTNAQGEDVVAGIRTAPKIAQMQTDMPEVYARVPAHRPAARAALPRRPGPRVHDRARQAVHAPDAFRQADRRGRRQDRQRPRQRGRHHEGGGARPDRARPRGPAPARPVRRGAPASAKRIVKGLNASPGAAVGRAVFDADTAVEWVGRGEKVMLVRIETSPDDFHGMAVAEGIITARGGATSHAAVVARQIGKPCVAGSRRPARRLRHEVGLLRPERASISRRATGSASTARPATCISARCRRSSARFEDQPELQTILGWADEVRRMQVWTNADKPEEAALARPTARRASACAGPSTCSARASGSRSCAARSSSPTPRRGPRPRPPPAAR